MTEHRLQLPKRLVRVGAFVAYVGAVAVGAAAQSEPTDVAGWESRFAHHYDYVLAETAGLDRQHEPVEVTLTMPGDAPEEWQDHIRVVRLIDDRQGVLTPHEVLGAVTAVAQGEPDAGVPHPAASVNVVFLARCPADGEVTYRLFWGMPEAGAPGGEALPTATVDHGLAIDGELPGLTIANEFYTAKLDAKSGAIRTTRRANPGQDSEMFYKTVPIHFGTDVWSPGQSWDHDYDWAVPPNQKFGGGATALRYHRWGPMQTYKDVVVSITYTFYAHVPYVQVSSTMTFTEDRSAHAVRMGEIVVSHSHAPGPSVRPRTAGESVRPRTAGEDERDADGKSPEIFSHYAWPGDDETVVIREINAHRDADGRANLEGVAPGALGILGRDVPWVAGYNAQKGYGMASLRKAQFAGNQLGGPVPHAAPCTYVANYGWGFTYWSRPMVYPLGAKGTALDQNTAIAAGTVFAIEEALLIFEPDPSLRQVRETHRQFTKPLRLQFKGTGPW